MRGLAFGNFHVVKILKISPHRTGWDHLESDAGIAKEITLDRTQGTTHMMWSEELERGRVVWEGRGTGALASPQ